MQSDNRPAISICHGPRCRDYGGEALLAKLEKAGIDAKACDCQSLCTYSPVVHLNKKFIPRATTAEVLEQLS